MSILSTTPVNGGPPINGTTPDEAPIENPQHQMLKTWQLPKLKVQQPVPGTPTPASFTPATSFSASSSPPMMAHTGCHASPDVIGFELAQLDEIPPLTLPRSPLDSQPTSPPADASNPSRPSGLIRRFSRGASNRLRGRSSLSNIKNRDQNAGSVVRRRSDSRGVVDGSYDISDMELEDTVEEEGADGDTPSVAEVTAGDQRPFHRTMSRRSSEKDNSRFLVITLKSTLFTKVTKKKKKQLRFGLDESSAKIFWSKDVSNSTRKQMYIDDMREIRVGETARNYLADFGVPEDQLSRWFTIVYLDPERFKGRPIKFMHLIAADSSTCDQWVNALQHHMKSRDKLMSEMAVNKEKHWLGYWHREMIKRFGTNQHSEDDEKMDFPSIKKMCRNFSIYKSDRVLRLQFGAADRNRCGALNLEQYLDLFRRLTERRDIRRIFDGAKSPNVSTMSLDQFCEFLKTAQMVDVSADPAHWLITYNKFASKKRAQVTDSSVAENSLEYGMCFEAFRDFLSSSANSPLKSIRSDPILLRPLNDYFISSSHNTYLEGRQFRGESSAEMYIEALKKGCRCIEIDCENGVDGRPCVTHVKTGTSRVTFLECIKVINQYAFWASDFPLIVSLEVHCNSEQQKLMAEIMKEQFGSRLLLQPLPGYTSFLPSPQHLKRRILIKVKVPHNDVVNFLPSVEPTDLPPFLHRRQRSLSAPDPRMIRPLATRTTSKLTTIMCPPMSLEMSAKPLLTALTSVNGYPSSPSASPPPSSSDESDADGGPNTSPKKNKGKSNIVTELGELGVYTRGVKFVDWKSPDSKAFNHVYSFNESTFENKCKTPEGKAALERHNVRCLIRVYPRATRFYSSNFDPLQFWRRGVQMVATNWQTYDLGTQINDAMFAAGADRSGYVLKPEELLRSRNDITESGGRKKLDKKMVTFSVDIISAQYLEAPNESRPEGDMSPYVEFEMYCAEDKGKGIASGEGGNDASARNGKSGIGSPVRKRTRIVEGNGFDPVFYENEKDSITMTLKTKYPSLIFVRWTVWNSPDGRSLSNSKEPLSSFTAKLSSLEQGYRHLPLYNKHGELLHSKLFCRIRKENNRSLEGGHMKEETTCEPPRASEDSVRSGKDFLRRVFNRTPSERRRVSRDNESGYFSRTGSTERMAV